METTVIFLMTREKLRMLEGPYTVKSAQYHGEFLMHETCFLRNNRLA